MTRSLVVERRAIAPPRSAPDPIAELLAAAASLQDVPRESAVTIPDVLFHSRRVAGRIRAAAERIERTWEPKGSAKRVPPVGAAPQLVTKREQHREITVGQGRRVRVLQRGRCAGQMELGF